MKCVRSSALTSPASSMPHPLARETSVQPHDVFGGVPNKMAVHGPASAGFSHHNPVTALYDQGSPAGYLHQESGAANRVGSGPLPPSFDAGSTLGFDSTSLESSILSSMLHDVDNAKLNGDSPDAPSVPAMDLMDSYTHVNNVHTREDVMGASSWNVQQPPMRQAMMGQHANEFGTMPSSFPGGQGVPLLGHAGVNPSLEKDPVMAPPMPTQEAGIRRGHSSRPEQDPAAEVLWKQRVAKVYRDKTEPFRYTEGYHILLKYATQKYDKADVLRIVRALAIYRPSLIALQMPLSEEDEIFVERAFQRTILEFEKLISLSGTPTVVWRRTCEISLVGTEFCMLTQWSKEDLMGKYIYQFMDKESVLNYWELFASHVFENTSQSVMTKCVLMTPSGKSIPCTWCFTIKRDPFELPGFVVGNFLPIM